MDVKMHTIMAGPNGCADAGVTISVPDAEAKRLIDGKFAVEAVTRPISETAVIDPAVQERNERDAAKAEAVKEAENKSTESIKRALDALNVDDDEDWTAGGKPAMGRVKELTGSTSLIRAEIEAHYPDFTRATASNATVVDETKSAGGEPAERTPSGARSSGL